MGHTDKGTIQNWYTADGLKIKSRVKKTEGSDPPKITNYISSAEYENSILQFIAAEEGRVVWEEDGTKYPEYFLKDHLGNTRARIADKNGDNLVYIDQNNLEEDELMNIRHYYPFGMEWDMPLKDMAGNSLAESELKNKYSYNGKEFQEDLGINLHYYGFRVYDPAIGRFTSVDPIAEEFAFVSGFNYAENEPIANIDLHGLQAEYSASAASLNRKPTKVDRAVTTTVNALIDVKNIGVNAVKEVYSYTSDKMSEYLDGVAESGNHIGTGTVFTSENAVSSDQVEKTADNIDGEANIDGVLSISGPGVKGPMYNQVTKVSEGFEDFMLAMGITTNVIDKAATTMGKIEKVNEAVNNKPTVEADSSVSVILRSDGVIEETFVRSKSKKQ